MFNFLKKKKETETLDDIPIIYEPFSSLKECALYYGDIFTILKDMETSGILQGRKLKKKTKFYFKQWEANERLIKSREKKGRELEKNTFTKPKTTPAPNANLNAQIEGSSQNQLPPISEEDLNN